MTQDPKALQGNPIPPGPRSTKVTNDPAAARNPIEEPSGPVPSDSLAAESATHGGSFAQNRGAQPTGPAGQTTLNNNLNDAEKLSSAPVGGLREDRSRQEKYPEALGGQGDFPGPHTGYSGYVGGSTGAKENQGAQTASASGSGYTSQYNAGQAPSYVADVTGLPGQAKPKGKNLHEGGFDSDPSLNASFNAEAGSRNDPGRAGEHAFQRKANESGPDAAGGPRQKGVDDQHPWQALERDQRA